MDKILVKIANHVLKIIINKIRFPEDISISTEQYINNTIIITISSLYDIKHTISCFIEEDGGQIKLNDYVLAEFNFKVQNNICFITYNIWGETIKTTCIGERKEGINA